MARHTTNEHEAKRIAMLMCMETHKGMPSITEIQDCYYCNIETAFMAREFFASSLRMEENA